jgi:hypothetical protein
MAYLSEPGSEDGGQLVACVRCEAHVLGLALGMRLETGQDPLGQIQGIRDSCNNRILSVPGNNAKIPYSFINKSRQI